MENFDDIENKSYERANHRVYTVSDHFGFLLSFFYMFARTVFALVSETFENLVNIFSNNPKDILGQLALVTGF